MTQKLMDFKEFRIKFNREKWETNLILREVIAKAENDLANVSFMISSIREIQINIEIMIKE